MPPRVALLLALGLLRRSAGGPPPAAAPVRRVPAADAAASLRAAVAGRAPLLLAGCAAEAMRTAWAPAALAAELGAAIFGGHPTATFCGHIRRAGHPLTARHPRPGDHEVAVMAPAAGAGSWGDRRLATAGGNELHIDPRRAARPPAQSLRGHPPACPPTHPRTAARNPRCRRQGRAAFTCLRAAFSCCMEGCMRGWGRHERIPSARV
jgi:hypothetical protein